MCPESTQPLLVRRCGDAGPPVLLLHGGPGAAGYLAPAARELADSFRVIEPMQRGSGAQPLTVARHVSDLDDCIRAECGPCRPAIVGHSWGAMLALAYAAEHPDHVGCLALVGCGTLTQCIRELAGEYLDPDEHLRAVGRLVQRIDSYDPTPAIDETLTCDARAHEETWQDMLRLQTESVYPAAFKQINVPVIMLHGADDPHPGRLICASLKSHLPQLEYVELQQCGHYPWLERAAHMHFFRRLRAWLIQHAPRTS
jgi:pimeloyl-ACP methyl ester carboxylesterase